MPAETIGDTKTIPGGLRFVFGGLSGMCATSVVQPMDLVKTRMQLLGTAGKNVTMISMTREVVSSQGAGGLYVGLSAALFRQATYTTGRLGCFTYITDIYTANYGVPNFGVKLAIGVVAGSVGALVGNPAEVALVRMTADGRLPFEQRRNYTNVFNALSRMIKEEGLLTLMRGTSATAARAAVLNAAQLGTYAQAREALLPKMGDGIPLHFCASMIAGFLATSASLPFDKVKTKVQNAAQGGSRASMIGVILSVIKKEGPLGLWSGFLPTYFKIGPHTVLTLIVLEQINAFYLSLA